MDFRYPMKDGFMFIHNNKYDTLVIDGGNLTKCIEYIRENSIEKIVINKHLCKEKDLKFLVECSHIKELNMYDSAVNIRDFSALYELPLLENLSIADNKVIVDLSAIKSLRNLSLSWNLKLINIQSCINLEQLYLTKYISKNADLEEIANLHKLKNLRIVQSQITSLKGYGSLGNLKKLELGYLRELVHLDELPNGLLELEIESCKNINNYDCLANLDQLEWLKLYKCGDISSLAFIKNMRSLKRISFVDTNILDGDLSPCLGLEYVGFNDKKHYSHKFKELNPTFIS